VYENVGTLLYRTEARYKMLRLSPELLLEGTVFNTRVSEDGKEVVAVEIEGLPKDVRIQAWSYDTMTNTILVRLWSSEFPELAEGSSIPPLEVMLVERRIPIPQQEAPPRGGYF